MDRYVLLQPDDLADIRRCLAEVRSELQEIKKSMRGRDGRCDTRRTPPTSGDKVTWFYDVHPRSRSRSRSRERVREVPPLIAQYTPEDYANLKMATRALAEVIENKTPLAFDGNRTFTPSGRPPIVVGDRIIHLLSKNICNDLLKYYGIDLQFSPSQATEGGRYNKFLKQYNSIMTKFGTETKFKGEDCKHGTCCALGQRYCRFRHGDDDSFSKHCFYHLRHGV